MHSLGMAKQKLSFFTQLQTKIENFFSGEPTTVTDAILRDHDALKGLMKVLKDEDESVAKKKTAFKLFRALLLSHSSVEEKVLYSISEHKKDTKRKTDEGFVEHDVAKTLLLKIKNPGRGPALDHWVAQVQVLSELVEHHLEEEERELIPKIRRELTAKQQTQGAAKFLQLRRRTQHLRDRKNLGALAK